MLGGGAAAARVFGGATEVEGADPDAALARLMRGNRRFATGRPRHPHVTPSRRRALKAGQEPFATILSCADSRVPPNVVFDQGLGDLFVVRTAGNLAGANEVASIAYALEHLGVDVVVVLGHEECGAVKATIDVVEGTSEAGEFAPLVEPITPAVNKARASGASGAELVAAAVAANVSLVTTQVVERSDIVAGAIEERGIAVVGAVYDLDTGRVVLQR